MSNYELMIVYIPLFLLVAGAFWFSKICRQKATVERRDEAIDAGLTQPASLHPLIDPAICIGCGACVRACPEGAVLGLIDGHAELIEPTSCIGHGACQKACPMDAIELVFGTEERGVDIPAVDAAFQTSVSGMYIAGELGGMGLVRNAIEQGRQAMQSIADSLIGDSQNSELDCLIVGAGPAGISASLQAQVCGLKFRTLEQDSFGGTVAHFPRGKLVMTAPVDLPGHGRMHFSETSKEELLEFWDSVIVKNHLEIDFNARVDHIERLEHGFKITSNGRTFESKFVLLAIGRRGTPRKLGVSGEDDNKVVYRLIDAEQYRGQSVLVVGGGDSALEAAISIAEQPDTDVSIAYRSAAFSRAKAKNREALELLEQQGRLRVLFQTTVQCIYPDTVELNRDGNLFIIQNNAVIVCAGGVLPTSFLKSVGIEVETKYGSA